MLDQRGLPLGRVRYISGMPESRQPGEFGGVGGQAASGADGLSPRRPPRPLMSDTTPAPAPRPIVVTGVVKMSMYLWFTSFVLGLMVAAFALVLRVRLLDRLTALIVDAQPDRSEETIRRVAELVFWGSLIALIAIVVIEALIMRVMLKRHGAARFVLLIALLVHVLVAVLADDFVGQDGEGIWFHVLLVLQLISAGAALIASFLPGSGAWFRDK